MQLLLFFGTDLFCFSHRFSLLQVPMRASNMMVTKEAMLLVLATGVWHTLLHALVINSRKERFGREQRWTNTYCSKSYVSSCM